MSNALMMVAALAALGLAGGWLWRFSRRDTERQRAALLAAPLASFDLDSDTLRAFADWQADDCDSERAAMLRRALKISLWLLAITTLAFTALGMARTDWLSGARIGIVCSGFVIVPLWTFCGGLALVLSVRARRLRSRKPVATRMIVGTQGIAFEPGEFQLLHGTPFAARMLEGPPLILDLSTCYGGAKGVRYMHARGPIPAAASDAGWAALKQVRERWNMPPQ